MPRPRSPARHCPSTAAGPPTERGPNEGTAAMNKPTRPDTLTNAVPRLAAERSPIQQTVLVLQGGGALGAYQAGVFQALVEGGVSPDWVIGTSIGAINGAIIAGNAPENRLPRLQEFWE